MAKNNFLGISAAAWFWGSALFVGSYFITTYSHNTYGDWFLLGALENEQPVHNQVLEGLMAIVQLLTMVVTFGASFFGLIAGVIRFNEFLNGD